MKATFVGKTQDVFVMMYMDATRCTAHEELMQEVSRLFTMASGRPNIASELVRCGAKGRFPFDVVRRNPCA